MQSMYQCECTSEEYVSQRLWLEASVPECDYCKPEGLPQWHLLRVWGV